MDVCHKENIFLFLFCILIDSCTGKNLSTDFSIIPVADQVGKYEILNISDIAHSITYIPLETNDDVLVHILEQIVYENEQFILRDWDLVYPCKVFDREGRFIHNLGKIGQGTNEYISLSTIYSNYNDSIFLFSRNLSKIWIYNPNGQLIDILKTDGIAAEYMLFNIWFLQTHFYLADVICQTSKNIMVTHPRSILLQADGNKLLTYRTDFPYLTIERAFDGFAITYEAATMYRFKDQIRHYKAINDTVFTTGPNMEMTKEFVFELGKYKQSIEQMLAGATNQQNNFIVPLNIMESINYLFIEYNFTNYAPEKFEYLKRWPSGPERMVTDYRVFGLFDKRTGELKLMNQPIKEKLGFKNDIDGGPVIWPKYISSNDELVSTIQPEEFMEYYNNIQSPSAELKKIADKLEIDDNPIVIITKLS